ncbi:efflux RND transporter permease subunit [Methylocapsa sp. D3K7]|uniref:efflux RND transporter permease subunit n=1 Tax=Methylocapsa sp. D3K7 TaxID=3041435 RepID=UPI00244EB8FF|nr:efflux RND transporter permease subunit [Methylocapsa sp. D3K7]WGJ14863.1 efflux RND transporter permease subunit [Methylocapsa sp. D3K7]
MGIVAFALRYRHTFYVLALIVLFLGGSAIVTMPKDIFPNINIPVVTVIWQYTGLTPEEMEQRVTTYSEYSISSNVSDIRNIESQTLSGVAVEKIFFQPTVNIDLAISQIVSASNAIRALMPTGIQPPVIVQYNASSVPVLQLSLSSDQLNEQQLYDYGIYRMRQALAPIPGITLPTPYGGKYRQVMIDIDPNALAARGITPNDIVNAVNAQSLTLPSGDAKMGDTQFIVRVNNMAPSIDALNRIPIKQSGGTTVYLSDVAHVRDGWAVQQNIVRTDGKRSVLLTIIKNGNASTLDVVNKVKEALPEIQRAAPPGMKIDLLFDQSVFVSNSIAGVLQEGAIAAGLTAVMILLFLGSWRSMLVVMVAIPLSIMTSIAVLAAFGQTINTMTLGGLALAVGILVDDSTVTIENTHRLLEEKRPFDAAVLEGAAGIAVPTLISTLAICCVFVSVFFLQGAARYLFTPLAMAVVFAMLASYAISRTLTPIMIGLLIRNEHEQGDSGTSWFSRFHAGFNERFDRFRNFYGRLLAGILRRRVLTPAIAGLIVIGGGVLLPFVGTDFFPGVDAGLIQLHVRAPARTRIERTERIFQAIEDNIRTQIPAAQLHLILDNIGLPARTYNLAFTDGSTIGVNDGIIQIELIDGHPPTAEIIKKLRAELVRAFPDVLFYFQPADLVTQVLNFGVPTQIDVQLQGHDAEGNKETAALLQQKLANIPGLVDVHVQQELNAPEMFYTIDRTRAQELGLNMQEVANNLNISLSSSEQVSPNFWTDPKTGVPYFMAVQTPEYRLTNKNQLENTVLASSNDANGTPIPSRLGNIATAKRIAVQSVFNQSNIQPVYDVYGSVQNRDLGGVAAAIENVVADLEPKLKPGNHIVVRGQIESMRSAFDDLGLGLTFAAVFVYMLMVVNYQSFLDPLAVILALPGAGVGILLLLFVTGTALSVPSIMGAIMSIGVASANSILLVTFAREQRLAGHSAFEAALSAGTTRLRPVLMTAAAMIVGMIPMAIGGPGEEQNAVLARAVIGGVAVGTITTLLFVPFLYSVIGRFGQSGAASQPRSQGSTS